MSLLQKASGASGVFRCDGEYWTLSFEGRTALLRDTKGIHHLQRLVGDPGREFHVMDLVALDRDRSTVHRALTIALCADAGPLLDVDAKRAYARRLTEIEGEIDDAHLFGRHYEIARLTEERESLVDELRSAVGLGGRERRAVVISERARASVTLAIRRAMKTIAEHLPELGQHFERTVRTGTYCSYLPDPRVRERWTFN